MASDGSVVFSTDLDTSGLKNSLNNLDSSIWKWTKSAGWTIAKAGAGLLTGVSAGMGALVKHASDYNSQMENYQTNFAVLLRDEAKAMEHVAYLRERAAKTPFGMEDLASASQTMLSFGLSAEKSNQAMEQLGDIALGDKSKFQMLTLAFSQISAAGKLSGQDLLQMVNAGFNPLNTIAEKTGTNLGDLKEVMAGEEGSDAFYNQMKAAQDEVEKLGDKASEGAKLLAQIGQDGYISAEMVGKAMEIETSPGGRFYNGMQKASETTTGMLSTLKDDASALTGEVFAPVTEQMGKTVIPTAQGYVQKLSDAFRTGGDTGLIDALGEVLSDALSKGVDAIPDMLETAKKLLKALGSAMKENASTMATNLADAITSAAGSLSETTTTLADAAFSIGSALMKELAKKLPDLVPSVVDTFTDLFVLLCENADDILSAGWEIAKGLIKGILNALPTLIGGVTEAFVALFTNTDEIANKTATILDEKFGSTLTAYETFQNGINDADNLFKDSIGDAQNRKEVALDLLDQYIALGEKATLTEADMEQMKTLAAQIVELFPSLKGVVADSTGTFTENADAIRQQIDALAAMAVVEAYQDYIKSLTGELVQLNIAIRQGEKEAAEVRTVFETADAAWKSAQATYDEIYGAGSQGVPGLVQNLETLKNMFAGTDFEGEFNALWQAIHNADGTLNEQAASDALTLNYDRIRTWMDAVIPLLHADAEAASSAWLDTQKVLDSMRTDADEVTANIATAKEDLKKPNEPITPTPPEGSPTADAINADTEAAKTAQAEQATAVKEGAKATGTAYTDGVSEGMDANKGTMETSAKGAVDGANKAAMTQTNQSSTVGYQIAAGMASGVRTGAPLLYNAVNSMIGNAYNAARRVALINSPSRLFANGVGAFLPAGAAMGVESNAWKLRKAVDDMISASMPQDGLELGFNVQPGYTQGRAVAAQMAPSQGLGVGAAQTIAQAVREGLRDMGVVMDGQRVGDIVTSTVSRNIEDLAWAGRFG